MSKTKKWAIAGFALVGAGLLICLITLAVFGFYPSQLRTGTMVSNTYEVSEAFDSLRIDADTEEIRFVPSADGACSVVCYEEENAPHQVRVENATLMIGGEKKPKVNFFLFTVTEHLTITVYLPQNSYRTLTVAADTGDTVIPQDFSFDSISVSLSTGDVTCSASADGTVAIETDTGAINLSDCTAAAMALTSDTGKISLSDVTLTENLQLTSNTGAVTLNRVLCQQLNGTSDTADLLLTDVLAEGEFRLVSDTGDITFNSCDAAAIYAKTDTGDIAGTLRGEKVFLTETDTGRINVPKTVTGGRCELITDTGDITIELT
ncbi:MAG: DUF4097 family beta strand repeat protein [Eubacterium sp.]|nr:DUF4097 family beta strand repeat protein [Eubacterium sp.]